MGENSHVTASEEKEEEEEKEEGGGEERWEEWEKVRLQQL